jgi:cyclopropane-fatty-acyl-phospholipid synthase
MKPTPPASLRSAETARQRRARRFFLDVLDRCLQETRVDFQTPVGCFAVGRREGHADFALRVHDPRFFERVIALGSLGLGESYMDGDFEMAEGRLEDWLTLLLHSRVDTAVRGDWRLALRALGLRAAARGKARNVQAHYDVGDDLFEAFLDSSLSYSCGYSQTGEEDLEELQWNKLERICQKLRLEPGMRLLDIGCGFGGLLIHAGREHGVGGVGISNSRRHAARAAERIEKAGLAEITRVEFGDYSGLEGGFDRVVSVGMLEHVPRSEHRRYFDTLARRLGPRGVALVHFIGCNAEKNEHDPFIQKYIFPGSGQPRLSEIAANVERSGLAIADVENIARHYALTIRGWLQRFQANRGMLDRERYDTRFQRMWEFYLCAGIAAGEASEAAVYQVLLQKDVRDPMPLVRV